MLMTIWLFPVEEKVEKKSSAKHILSGKQVAAATSLDE